MKKTLTLTLILVTPLAASAQQKFGGLLSLIHGVGNIVQALIPIVAGLALLYFFWGLATFIRSAGDEKKHADGINIMKYGLIALFVMVSVWGIVGFIQGELGLPRTTSGNPSFVGGGSTNGGAFGGADPGCGAGVDDIPC
ncbi:MAG: pilin [Patescibacteria group bacterium]